MLLSSSLSVSAASLSTTTDAENNFKSSEEYYSSDAERTVDGSKTSYKFNLKSDEELVRTLENEENDKNSKLSRSASGHYEYVYRATGYVSTGYRKFANQPIAGVSFRYGGNIYYKDGFSFSVPVSISVGGKYVGFSVGIGAFTQDPNQYAVYIPGGGRRYHGYVNKTYRVVVYDKYWCTPSGTRSYVGKSDTKFLYSLDFDAR